jgi:RNA recognition motif-containing protein
MATKLFVAGLSYSMTDSALSNLFAEYGTVTSAQIITDRETNRSKGFGFVEMSSEDESKKAIQGLNGKEVDGRPLTVNEARPREDRPSRPFQGGGGGGRPNTMGNNYRRSRR